MNFVLLSTIYLILDILWITIMTPLLYRKGFETIQKTPLRFNVYYAILAYVTLLGVLYWICRPLSKAYKRKWIAYALVGFALYSVYNFTNGAVFSEYSSSMVFMDTLWGTGAFTLLGILDSF